MDLLRGTPYVAYTYGYPHKTAYRLLTPPRRLADVWAEEPRESLFLYLHVPFCEQRCGFCNLFTIAGTGPDRHELYLDALDRQAEAVRAALEASPGTVGFSRLAIGGGTPTVLSAGELRRLFGIVAAMGCDPCQAPGSVEASPATVDAEKLSLLRDAGFERLSLGIQAFEESTCKSLGRTQSRAEVEQAIGMIRDAGFPILNLDLIYGGEGQSLDGWTATVREALAHRPEEIYLYPLYIRPLTGLSRLHHSWDDQRLDAYRAGRDLLLAAGYRQISMRMFSRGSDENPDAGPLYCCQKDGMVGLGCGARSYTRTLHYSTEWAVGRSGVREILDDYIQRGHRDDHRFAAADYGFILGPDEQRRRFVLLSLLQNTGLDLIGYRLRFGGEAMDDLRELADLAELGLARREADRLVLTAEGLERSDAIGPWLSSRPVAALQESYALR